jgi:hydroxyethylthiazole kinase-like uncharacterized protein yjeF
MWGLSWMDHETISTPEMRAVEANAEYYGVSLLQLMETAGRNVAEEIAARFSPKKTRVAIFCGSGGNGGDGFVAARYLTCYGFKVEVILAARASNIAHESAKQNWVALQHLKTVIPITEIKDSTLIPDVAWNRLNWQTPSTNQAVSRKNQRDECFSCCCGCSHRN